MYVCGEEVGVGREKECPGRLSGFAVSWEVVLCGKTPTLYMEGGKRNLKDDQQIFAAFLDQSPLQGHRRLSGRFLLQGLA